MVLWQTISYIYLNQYWVQYTAETITGKYDIWRWQVITMTCSLTNYTSPWHLWEGWKLKKKKNNNNEQQAIILKHSLQRTEYISWLVKIKHLSVMVAETKRGLRPWGALETSHVCIMYDTVSQYIHNAYINVSAGKSFISPSYKDSQLLSSSDIYR